MMEPSRKRQRPLSNAKGAKKLHYSEIPDIQNAQFEGDSLASPAIRKALDDFVKSRRQEERVKEAARDCLRRVKESLDKCLPEKPVGFSVTSKRAAKLIRKLSQSTPKQHLFHSPGYENLSVECEKPTSINVVGSFLLGYASSSRPVVDIAVEMPSDLFQSKDYINYKYHDKRLLYLMYIAHHLTNKDDDNEWINMSLSKHSLAGLSYKPTLTFSHKNHTAVTIRLIPTIAPDVFDASRLGDDRKNVRPAGTSPIVSDESEATIQYNQSILMDCAALSNLKSLHAIIKVCTTTSTISNFTEAVLLLDAWNIRHRFNIHSKFLFAVIIATLMSQSIIPSRASREHILRCVFNFIRSHKQLVQLRFNNVRVCAPLNPATTKRMSECASNALLIIESETAADDPWNGVIPYLFASARGTKAIAHPLSTIFDGFIRFSNANGEKLSLTTREKIESVLQQGLVQTRRISRFEAILSAAHDDDGLYGLTFISHEDIIRKVDIIDKSSNSKDFKAFWGPKASLRRFKDGKIAESLIWCGGIQTLNEILQYLTKRHLSASSTSSEPDDNDNGDETQETNLVCKVYIGELEKAAKFSESADSESTSVAISAFNELATLLRSIEGIPLKIHSVHATSAHLRRCGIYPIRPNKSNRFIEPLEIVVKFESSNAWPDDPLAITASKAAFYISLKTKLSEQGVKAHATISYLEIYLGDAVFWLRVNVDKEHELLQHTEQGRKLLWETETIVRHHDDFRRIESVSITQVCRLAKRWLNSQLLFRAIGARRDSIVELLVVGVMCHPLMGRISSTMRGFCQFLNILANFPWEVCPLVVSFLEEDDDDINDRKKRQSYKKEEEADRYEAIQQAQKHYDSLKRSNNSQTFGLYVAHGQCVKPWLRGKDAVEGVIWRRLRMTARAALGAVEKYLSGDLKDPVNLSTLFAVDVHGFDMTVKLDTEACVVNGDSKLRKGLRFRTGYELLPGLDPVDHVWTQLEQRLGKYALFLGRFRSGSAIHVVWRPDAHRKDIKFALKECAFCEFDGDDDNVLKISEAQLIDEIHHICQGLVSETTLA